MSENDEFREVHVVELALAKELLAVCAKHNLRCYADGGTLLGAARHQGFIPWDDDMDFVMPRRDYDILMKIGPEEFQEPLFFQSAYTDTDYIRPHIQLRNSQTCGALRGEIDLVRFNQGIFIDVFPLDDVPDGFFRSWPHSVGARFYKKLLSGIFLPAAKDASLPKRAVKGFLGLFYPVTNRLKMYRRFEEICRKYEGRCENFTLLSLYDRWHFRWLRKEWYTETVDLPFEDTTLPCPREYEKVLTVKFGDWKVPKRGGSMHGSAVFDVHRSYLDVIEERKQSAK